MTHNVCCPDRSARFTVAFGEDAILESDLARVAAERDALRIVLQEILSVALHNNDTENWIREIVRAALAAK